jgi:hypothetical protein
VITTNNFHLKPLCSWNDRIVHHPETFFYLKRLRHDKNLARSAPPNYLPRHAALAPQPVRASDNCGTTTPVTQGATDSEGVVAAQGIPVERR